MDEKADILHPQTLRSQPDWVPNQPIGLGEKGQTPDPFG